MQPEDIDIHDWYRVLFGQVPLSFLIEVVLRTLIIYFIILISMRALGKRMAGQLNKNEMVTLTTLAASIGVPWQAPDRGLLPAIIIAVIVVCIGRLTASWSARNKRVEALTQDTLSVLIEDGVMQLAQMKKSKITRERLFAYLRSEQVVHLGSVQRVYLEAGGFFTLVKATHQRSGLLVLPGWDSDFINQQKRATQQVCTRCGKAKNHEQRSCSICGNEEWVNAAE